MDDPLGRPVTIIQGRSVSNQAVSSVDPTLPSGKSVITPNSTQSLRLVVPGKPGSTRSLRLVVPGKPGTTRYSLWAARSLPSSRVGYDAYGYMDI